MSKPKPKSIKIFGQTFKFQYVDLEDQDIDGEVKAKKSLIIIDENLEGEELQHTMLHEIGHAIFHRMGWKQSIPHELEEVIVDTYATFLIDNYDFDL